MCLCLLHSLAVVPVVSTALADRGNEHFAALNSASLKPRPGTVRAFRAFQINTKMRQKHQSDRAEPGVSVLLTQTQPPTVSDPQAMDSAPACCRRSRHPPGNADVLEEKQELNKASRFVTIATWCHGCTAQPWASADAGELLRPPEQAELRQSHPKIHPSRGHLACGLLENVSHTKQREYQKVMPGFAMYTAR